MELLKAVLISVLASTSSSGRMDSVMTVKGWVSTRQLGTFLSHEHLISPFGATFRLPWCMSA